jgi:Flp pilus assembly protein TadD
MIRRPAIAPLLLAATLAAAVAACSGASVKEGDAGKAEFHFKLARNLYGERNLPMAQRELHMALKLNPGHAEAWHLKGFILMGLDDLPGSAAAFQEALRLNPELQESRNNLGTVYIAQGLYEDAVRTLKPLTEDPLYSTPAFAHGNLGWAYYQLGDTSSARRHLEMSVFLNPKFCLGHNNLGMLHRDLGNLRVARESFEKAVQWCPKYDEPYYHLGVLLQQQGDAEGARAMFAKCAEVGGESPMGKRCKARQ